MSLSVAGVWAVDVWDQTVWADDVWREGEYTRITFMDGVMEEEEWYHNRRKQYANRRRIGWNKTIK